jgi:hypothetical protein
MLLAIVTAGLCAQSLDSSDNQPPSTQATSTARSTRAQWSSTVNAFATALLDSSDSTMHSLLADDVIVRQFNRAGRQQLSQLRDHVSGMRVIMCSAYPQTPNSLAGDIANAIKDVPLPEDVKRRLTPPDEANLKRANATASKWISASLFTSGSEPVAVVVLWKEGMEPATTQPGVAAGDDDDLAAATRQRNPSDQAAIAADRARRRRSRRGSGRGNQPGST